MSKLNITNFEPMCRMLKADGENEFEDKYALLYKPRSYKIHWKDEKGIYVNKILYIVHKNLENGNKVKVDISYFDVEVTKLSSETRYFDIKIFKEGFKTLVSERINDIV